MNKFHSIKITEIKNLTTDSVEIVFDTNNHLFYFNSGQYISIKHTINIEEIRRAY